MFGAMIDTAASPEPSEFPSQPNRQSSREDRKLVLQLSVISRRRWYLAAEYGAALVICALCTWVSYPLYPSFGPVNTVMLYLLATALSALRLGRGTCTFLAVANMLAFDFFFVPPTFSFAVADTRYIFTLFVMLVVAVVITQLMISIRRHRESADARERRTAVLYAMSRELLVATDPLAISAVAIRHISAVFHSRVAVITVGSDSALTPLSLGDADIDAASILAHYDLSFAREVAIRGARAYKDAIYLPLLGNGCLDGVLIVRPDHPPEAMPRDLLDLLDIFAAQLTTSLQRARQAEAAEASRLAVGRAQLRNTLLESISHDLRTPLAAIAGAGSLIAQEGSGLNENRKALLGQLIERKAADMTQLLSNVLDLAKMELADQPLRADWHALEDLVAHSLGVNASKLAGWRTVVCIPGDLPLIFVEANLIVQILSNLLQNAAKYTPRGSTITVSARVQCDFVVLEVADDGPGLPADPERLFEKFQRGSPEDNIVGVGLGLAICRTAARLHGGDIRGSTAPGGGARFEITLPVSMRAEPVGEVD